MRLAILGGSFDPVHNGHLSLAAAVHSLLHYDKILLIPSNISPHKLGLTPVSSEHRLQMLHLAIEGRDYLHVENCELSREGVSFTIDTLQYLTNKYVQKIEGKIGLIIGSDLVSGFSSWKDSSLIPEYADIILGCRPGSDPSVLFDFPHIDLENTLFDISSSMIRHKISCGAPWSSLVPNSVYRYIVKYGLYES